MLSQSSSLGKRLARPGHTLQPREHGGTWDAFAARGKAMSSAQTPAECHRVLVVDEWLSLRNLTRRLTQKYAITTLSFPSEALERIEQGDSWDAILAFIMMPEMSGFEFFRRMRQARPDLAARLVLMTDTDLVPHVQSLQSKSCVPIVTKPVDPEAFVEALTRAVCSR